ncbi:MAG: hypothetical protein M0P73_01475, partial [Syntrophobacterales bacterium]|nr:hypothetical protein [Syntrophobacterales bacterium]
ETVAKVQISLQILLPYSILLFWGVFPLIQLVSKSVKSQIQATPQGTELTPPPASGQPQSIPLDLGQGCPGYPKDLPDLSLSHPDKKHTSDKFRPVLCQQQRREYVLVSDLPLPALPLYFRLCGQKKVVRIHAPPVSAFRRDIETF